MSTATSILVDLAVISLLVVGISQFRTPRGARFGNHAAGLALAAAIFLVLVRNGVTEPWTVGLWTAVGGLVGVLVALRVSMTRIPGMVALQHGMGGVAAFLVSSLELVGGGAELGAVGKASGFLGLAIGAATFSGSLLAAAKLDNRIRQAPTRLKGHNALLAMLGIAIVAVSAVTWTLHDTALAGGVVLLVVLSVGFGVLFAIRIGGADMPVLISFLNATAGLAAAFCGVIIQNRLLIACGATVASSGSILTHVMCKSMNRNLANIFLGATGSLKRATDPGSSSAFPGASPAAAAPTCSAVPGTPLATRASEPDTPLAERLAQVAKVAVDARKIIVVPGYGMALAQAQFALVTLTKRLEELGKDVRFAIHPVAGRMPGHMNVLLAEAEVDYEQLCEMDDVNREFPDTDLVLIVGACDVVNPAAIHTEGTPLSGMPILMAHTARHVAVCNLDARPGYSGVENPLYSEPKTVLLFGDALETIQALGLAVDSAATPVAAGTEPALAT